MSNPYYLEDMGFQLDGDRSLGFISKSLGNNSWVYVSSADEDENCFLPTDTLPDVIITAYVNTARFGHHVFRLTTFENYRSEVAKMVEAVQRKLVDLDLD